MDFDGQFAISEIRRIDFRSTDQNIIGLYPNPARNKTTLVFEKAPRTNITVKIYNGIGQIVRTHTFTAGQNVYDLDVKGMAQGIYHVAINGDAINEHRKLMIE
jgi:hypothetical protein